VRHILHNDYEIQITGERFQNGHHYYYNDDYHYVTMSTDNKKVIYMEQFALAHFLVDQGFYQTTLPIPNIYGEWFFKYKGQQYVVLKIIQFQTSARQAHGQTLAYFHKLNRSYPYEPKHVSSYGGWYDLWIDKLTMYERHIQDQETVRSHPFYQLLHDVFPYIIGVSENAVQTVRETDNSSQFNESDQGTITFQRYDRHVLNPTIILNDLAYDHLTRDLAEYIRSIFLQGEKDAVKEGKRFLQDYQSVQSLSHFSWRSLYARLVYPIHFFDLIAHSFNTKDLDGCYNKLQTLIDGQPQYEERVQSLYEFINSDYKLGRLPELQWS